MNQIGEHFFTLAVRTSHKESALLPELVSTLHQINLNLGVSNEITMFEKIDTTQASLLHRFSVWLVGGFAAMALILGVVGLYGVISYSVGQRTREIGVRMALGAQRRTVYSLVMCQAAWLTLTGLSIELLCPLATPMLMRSLLFVVQAWDAATLVSVSALLGVASLAASFSARTSCSKSKSSGSSSRRIAFCRRGIEVANSPMHSITTDAYR